MIPDFKYFVRRIKTISPARHIIDRCNLTILFEPQQENLAEFLASHTVENARAALCVHVLG